MPRRWVGSFILRFDDTDLERSKKEYAESIEHRSPLARHFEPDVVERQSDRVAAYEAAAEKLKDRRPFLPVLRNTGRAGTPALPSTCAWPPSGL
jgi:hypothetical protein